MRNGLQSKKTDVIVVRTAEYTIAWDIQKDGLFLRSGRRSNRSLQNNISLRSLSIVGAIKPHLRLAQVDQLLSDQRYANPI